MAIGFGRGSEKEALGLETIHDIQKLLQFEVDTYESFEQKILRELREIKDIEHNLKLTQRQFESIEKLAQVRKEVFEKCMIEARKRAENINLDLCQKYLDMIQHLDAQLKPMLNGVHGVLSTLVLKDTHTLYQQNKSNKEIMDRIDEQARALMANVQIISRNVFALDEDFKGILEIVQRLRAERIAMEKEARKSLGFE